MIHFEFLFVCGIEIRVQLLASVCVDISMFAGEMPSGRKETGPERGTDVDRRRTEVQSVGQKENKGGLRV